MVLTPLSCTGFPVASTRALPSTRSWPKRPTGDSASTCAGGCHWLLATGAAVGLPLGPGAAPTSRVALPCPPQPRAATTASQLLHGLKLRARRPDSHERPIRKKGDVRKLIRVLSPPREGVAEPSMRDER